MFEPTPYALALVAVLSAVLTFLYFRQTPEGADQPVRNYLTTQEIEESRRLDALDQADGP